MSKRPSFSEVKHASLRSIDQVLSHWLPGGKRVDGGKEYTAPNPTRADKHAGSLKVNLAKATWCDFATGDKGGDLIDLVRYLDRGTDVEACNKLAAFLGVEATNSTNVTPPTGQAKKPEWVPVLPIPEQAMQKVLQAHRQYGKPSKVWIYRDAKGQPLMVLYRFDLGPDESGTASKVFAPLTWCKRSANGSRAWRWQGLSEPRPLLRLDDLAKRPSAPVVLCEGEKAADAAAELLPEHVATCWPNGTNSWQKADFAALVGRDLLLWPDNDAPGLKCMDALADHLRKLGAASVQTVALTVFRQLPGMDGERPTFAPGGEWREGDDAADAQSKGWTAQHLSELQRTGELFALAPAATLKPTKQSKATDQAKPQSEKKLRRPRAASVSQRMECSMPVRMAKHDRFVHGLRYWLAPVTKRATAGACWWSSMTPTGPASALTSRLGQWRATLVRKCSRH